MAQVIPKLNLNKTPALVENNSLIFAKNIRLDVDGTIHRDYGVLPMSLNKGKYTEHIVDYQNIINRIISDIEDEKFFDKVNIIKDDGEIVGVIADSNDFYLFIYGNETSAIVRYNEADDKFYPCLCNWNWSGGTIDGCVIKNLVGDTILNIGEYNTNKLVPLKSINLNNSKIDDDETIYTQTPSIPITNIHQVERFSYVIPLGVYQFFVRYKIKDDFYTDWFPASNEIFVGNTNNIDTSFGSLKYVNTNRDSDNSFVLKVKHLIETNEKPYESFQLGFILSHDDTQVARAWKHFGFGVNLINFDYKASDAEEIEVIDMLKVTYNLYNVGNITTFKNKLYISNYTETNFDDDNLQEFADNIEITIKQSEGEEGYSHSNVVKEIVNGEEVISGIVLNNSRTPFNGANGLIYKMIYTSINGKLTIAQVIENALNNKNEVDASYVKMNGITIECDARSLNFIKENIKKDWKDRNHIGNGIWLTHEITSFDDTISKITFDGEEINSDEIIPKIYNTKRYLTLDGIWVNDRAVVANKIEIELTRSYNLHISEYNESTDERREDYSTIDYIQTITIFFGGSIEEYSISDSSSLLDYTTLIPYQKYKFYIHFVKSNGEITNGYECKQAGELEATYAKEANVIIHPIFRNIKIPKGYVACFFSIVRTKNTVATLFNINDAPNSTLKESSCFDVNMMLVPESQNIHVKQDTTNTDSGKYYYSSNSEYPRYFGADGVVTFEKEGFTDDLAYIINDYTIPKSKNIELIKCTPYINTDSFEDFKQMNLLGFICGVVPLNRQETINYYSDGSSVYRKSIENGEFLFEELSKYNDADKDSQIANFSLKHTDIRYIYSNYNLNYISLSEEPKMSIKTYYNRGANEIGTKGDEEKEQESKTKLMRLLSSQLMSDVYELDSMYKSYVRKTYSIYNKDSITRFDNTIRSSILYGDENKVYVIKFDANDYYNIPTNRGTITNLVAVGDAIVVHTKDSMFKFSGSNNLQSTEGEILTNESQPFDTGVAEIFGSDFGFAGMQYKEDHIITENGYIFFDRDSRIVYLYSGQGQIAKINDTIEKLFRHKDIQNVRFANDYYNHRFFVCILFIDDDKEVFPVTLSFNTSENSKAFVSLHDFYYHKAFNTKTKCYFFTEDNKDVCKIDKVNKGCYSKLSLIDNTYPQIQEEELFIVASKDDSITNTYEYPINCYNSIIDIIDNNQFETIKVLNNIIWCGNKVKKEFVEIENNDITTLMIAEDINYDIPCKAIRIYSDSCISPLIDCTKVSNKYSISNINSYMLPRYNQGLWMCNYFRNIINSKGNVNPYVSDENSLIEGKYFVARFIFDSDFKFETLTFNTNIKNG